MTTNEARYVLEHRHEYTTEMVLWALEILERAGCAGDDV